MSKPTPKPQSTSASTASARFNAENDRIKQQILELLRQDAIENFASFKSKLKKLVLPSGYVTVMKDKVVEFRNIALLPDETTAPKLLTSIIVTDNLKVKAFVTSVLVPPKLYKYLQQSASLKSLSELANILAFCKGM